jgi:membrane protease YdiL (CAAX protease family)
MAVRNAAPGSIFLDGAAQGQPFLDPKREVYNLDHHQGCVRAFTLATCEQAMVLIRNGLDLRQRDWTVHANDADLDTVLAIWVLLNHLRLNDASGETRARIMPLLRLEGAIDAHGLELQDLCALPPSLLAETEDWIAQLREQELAFKARGRWLGLGLVEYTAELLRAVDGLVYPPQQFDDVEEVEELARTGIAGDSIAIVCRATVGIYEVERQLRRLHGKRLGVIALQTSASTYSLRQVDPYLPATLAQVYTLLNLVDPAAGGYRSANRWGGSAEIGGSPRSTGTRVAPEQIARVCRQAFDTPSRLQRFFRIAGAALRSVDIMVAALASVFVLGLFGDPVALRSRLAPNLGGQFSVLLGALGAAVFLLRGVRAPGVHGLRRPAGVDWCFVLPFALVGALAGGVWIPAVHGASTLRWTEPLGVLALPLAAEVIFRGLFHGGLVTRFRMQRCGGPWFLSWPAIVSAVLYALWGALLQLPSIALARAMPWGTSAWPPLLGAVVFGAAAGMARERSGSIVPPILLHWFCVAAVLLAYAHLA